MTGSLAVFEALAARGLDVELASRMDFSTDHRPDVGGEVLVIPFKREGVTVRRKYRTFGPDKRFSQDKGGVRCAWNEDCLRDVALDHLPVIITEGELDALAVIQAGHHRVISVPDGAPPPGERDEAELRSGAKYAWWRDIEALCTVGRVPHFVLAVDGDENGAALLQDLSVLIGRARCKFLIYPKARDAKARGRDRLKDLGEVLEEYGERGVKAALANASWMKVEGVFRMTELAPLPPSVVYALDRCDLHLTHQHFRPRLGDLSVVTGVPGFGKSTWVNDIWCRVAQQYGVVIGWASFEQAPQRDHRRALRTWFHQIPEGRQLPNDLEEADAWIDAHHRFIVPSEDADVTLDWWLDRAEAAVVQHGCKVLVLDPWNEMDHARGIGESVTEYTGRAIKTIKRFAKAFQVHVNVVAHPAKMRRGEDGNYPMPSLYDISDSAHWYNKPDTGVIIHRPDKDTTLMKVQKSRYHDVIGRPGSVKLAFCEETRRYVETEQGEAER